jgi:SPP1 family predicted phage head-tail adaptor
MKQPTLNTKIAQLHTRFVLEAPTDVMDDTGSVTRTYSVFATVWGRIIPKSGQLNYVADRQEQAISYRVDLRYRTGVTAAMRLRKGTRIFRILDVVDDDRRRFLTLECEENTP